VSAGSASLADPSVVALDAGPVGVRLLVVDDHGLIQTGFRAVLARQPWVARCATAGDAETAIALARRFEPHVAVVDLFLRGQTGLSLVPRLLAACPRTKVLLLAPSEAAAPGASSVVGVRGVLSKSWAVGDIVEAVRRVTMERPIISTAACGPVALTDREHMVLGLVASGATNREIGAELHLSPNTVKDHTVRLFRKLAVRNRAEAVQRGLHLGLLD
jgi:DNA-binding NarL/FixJ family response regulator